MKKKTGITRKQAIKKTFTDPALTLSETGSNFKLGAGRTITETYSAISDSVSKLLGFFRTLTKTYTRSESVARQTPTASRVIYEGYTMFDSDFFDPLIFDTVFNPLE